VSSGAQDYRVDVVYPGRFHRETMPGWLHAVGTALGRRLSDPAQNFRYCELGCGDGLNLVLAATLYPHGHFIGLDLDPLHIAAAQQLATAVGLENADFVQGNVLMPPPLLQRGDFDFVVSHGMWSWVAEHVRRAATDLAVAALKPAATAVARVCGYL
jgi:SAM-dependent methyltransferase